MEAITGTIILVCILALCTIAYFIGKMEARSLAMERVPGHNSARRRYNKIKRIP